MEANGQLTETNGSVEPAVVHALVVSSNELTNLSGLEQYSRLAMLQASRNKLTSLSLVGH